MYDCTLKADWQNVAVLKNDVCKESAQSEGSVSK